MNKKTRPGAYPVGFGKPPAHARFRKGRSGNPGGRPRGMTPGRIHALALKEAYRPVTVREGDKVTKLPAMQAVLRSLVARAAQGNGPAQRDLLETVRCIEKEIAAQMAANSEAQANMPPISDLEVARRIAFILAKAAHSQEQNK